MFNGPMRTMENTNWSKEKNTIGVSNLGLEMFAVDMSEIEKSWVLGMSRQYVTPSRELWNKLISEFTSFDRQAYEILMGVPMNESPTMENLFTPGRCFTNSFFAGWIMNGRQLRSVKYDIAWSHAHCALISNFTHKVMDPTFEAHPEASGNEVWQHGTVIALAYEQLGRGNSHIGIPRNSFEEIQTMEGFVEGFPTFKDFMAFVSGEVRRDH